MKTKQHHFSNNVWKENEAILANEKCQLVLAFGSSENLIKPDTLGYLSGQYPNAAIVFSSTAGEISGSEIYDNSVVATAIQLEKSSVKCVQTNVGKHLNSFETGSFLMQELRDDNLSAIFIISDGTYVNGSELVEGFNKNNTTQIPITGGMAGDYDRFQKTFTGLNEVPAEGNVIAIGFYGTDLLIGHGSFGGWDEFGPERVITRSEKNVLYELDNKNALDLYKQYLGDYVAELPGSALLFPLSIKTNGSDKHLVRTILSVDEEKKSMTFAGNIPTGAKVRLMKANFDKLIDASSTAAKDAFAPAGGQQADLAIMISCVGRKLILQDRTEEEVEAAREVLGQNTTITGFYSYGELSPFNPGTHCELHNQTMTITTFTER